MTYCIRHWRERGEVHDLDFDVEVLQVVELDVAELIDLEIAFNGLLTMPDSFLDEHSILVGVRAGALQVGEVDELLDDLEVGIKGFVGAEVEAVVEEVIDDRECALEDDVVDGFKVAFPGRLEDFLDGFRARQEPE